MSASGQPQRIAVVIVNPAARRAVPPRVLEDAALAMRARGWHVSVEAPANALDARARAARHASAGVDALVACGGDGTLLTVVNGVRDAGAQHTAVGVIPAGTANVWAAQARVPRDPRAALALIAGGERRAVDLGSVRIGEGPALRFLLVCGVGLDAAVIEAVDRRPAWKRRAGRLAFAAPALTALRTSPATDTRIEVDGVPLHAPRLLLALASNTRRYGGVAALTRRGEVDDGLLEVTLFEGDRSPVDRMRVVLQALRGRLDERAVRGVTHRQAARLVLTPARPLPVEVDGDAIGHAGPDAPLHIEVERRAVAMIFGGR